jgi:hypothetical protein
MSCYFRFLYGSFRKDEYALGEQSGERVLVVAFYIRKTACCRENNSAKHRIGVKAAWACTAIKFDGFWRRGILFRHIVQMLRTHQRLIMNWFKARDVISLRAVEGLNNKEVTRKAYGFRTYKAIEIALGQTLRALPELNTAHRFV